MIHVGIRVHASCILLYGAWQYAIYCSFAYCSELAGGHVDMDRSWPQ